MDIKVITRHAQSNYGSLLQTIATQTVLERLGHRCEIIDYWRDDEHGLDGVLTYLKNKPAWNKNLLRKAAFITVRYTDEKLAELKFSRMRSRYLHMTKRFCNCDDLNQLNADVFMTGSDQVWGAVQNGSYDGAYFLTFVKDKPKIAYAASFGHTDFTPGIVKDYKRMLSDYTAISVREDSAATLLYEWGVRCSGQVLDPTLMLAAEDWSKYIGKEKKSKYVLVYQIHKDPRVGIYAKRFADHVGLPLVRISSNLRQIIREGRFKWLPDLSEFLSYVKNSTYMITDSFHGTAFAINFNRQFFEILPTNNTGSRNMSILNLTGLTSRIVSDLNDFSHASAKIDYVKVNAVLNEERRKSLEVLNSILSDARAAMI